MSAVLELLGASACAEARRGLRAGEQLRAQILALSGGAGTVLAHLERPWASITFRGSRHIIKLRFDREDEIGQAEAMLTALPDHEFIIPGQLAAEVAVVEMDQRNGDAPRLDVTIKALLLEED